MSAKYSDSMTAMSSEKTDFVLAVLQHSLQEQERNVSQGGSCWGCNANAALIFLSQYTLLNFILSDDFDASTDGERISQYVNSDLCLFTIRTGTPGIGDSGVRNYMARCAIETAAPVVGAVKGSELENTVMYKRLKSAVDHLSLMIPAKPAEVRQIS